MDNQQTELTLDYKVPVLAVDGQIIITKASGSIDLAFLQFNKPGQPVADVVAAMRLHNADALRDLHTAIGEHLDKEINREA